MHLGSAHHMKQCNSNTTQEKIVATVCIATVLSNLGNIQLHTVRLLIN